ncbi:MAG TPA: PaaI family thioesterase [Acidimicrobiales bacterium]|nr:PaaI family thioesterase [Acidimicrobiales bacterium]
MQVPPNCDLTLGMVCLDKATPGRTVWRMKADERFANTAGIIQGGFIGAFADSAMGASAVTFALAGQSGKVGVANAEMKVSFLRPVAVGTDLTCEATVVSGGERVVFCEATVSDGAGRLAARASSTYLVTPRS